MIAAGFVWLFGDLFAPRFVQPSEGGRRLRVMTFNLLNDWSNTDLVLREIRGSDADIVALVECSARKARAVEQALGDVYPYRVQFGDGIPGLGLISKYPIRDPHNFKLNSSFLYHLRATVDVDGRPVTVVVAHPEPPGLGWGGLLPRYVVRGSADIAELSRQAGADGPGLLMGDFNAADIADDVRAVGAAGLVDAFREAGYGLGVTWPARRMGVKTPPLVRIDYVFHTHHFTATRAWVGGETGSDHLPVVADLEWREK